MLESREEKNKLNRKSYLEDGNHKDGSKNELEESDNCTMSALGE